MPSRCWCSPAPSRPGVAVGPVDLADVVRVAMGEIEDYGRIRLHTIADASVAGSVAVDLAHLTSELMENATQFSPPETGVEVVGHRASDGSYQLTISDKGIGMSTEAINAANSTLAEPPLVGLDLSRSLGFTVVSRLAHRLGVSVWLSSSAQGGVTATVTIPADMVGESTGPVEAAPSADETPVAPMPMPTPPRPHRATGRPSTPRPHWATSCRTPPRPHRATSCRARQRRRSASTYRRRKQRHRSASTCRRRRPLRRRPTRSADLAAGIPARRARATRPRPVRASGARRGPRADAGRAVRDTRRDG